MSSRNSQSPTVAPTRRGQDGRRRVPGEPLRLAIVSDFELVVAGVEAMMAAHRDRVVVVRLPAHGSIPQDVDVVLCDSTARRVRGGIDSHELAGRGVRVIACDWTGDPASGDPAVTPGVNAHLSKCLTGVELVEAVEEVCGRRASGYVVRGRGEVSRSGDWPGVDQGLTRREAEIVALIARGLSNQEIAEAVYLSINSVKTHIRTAYRKLGVTRRAQAVGWGFRHGYAAGDAGDRRAVAP